jgi:molybdate transport system regulatory protein
MSDAKPDLTSAQLKMQVRLLLGDEIAIGSGKADLLAAIAQQGSISAAARQMGMSYRRAWLLVDTMNRCFKAPVVVSNTGGKHGGGAHLSPLGVEVLAVYQAMMAELTQQVAPYATRLLALLADQPVATQVHPEPTTT